MKRISSILLSLCFSAFAMQAQTVKGPIRNAVFVVKPEAGGYEVQITLKYRFQLCAGDVTLDGFRTKHEPLAYWFGGKRYTEAEIKGGCKFKIGKSDLCPNLDFSADLLNEFPGSKPGAFPGCCNPASIAFTSDGQLLTSEKGNPRVCLFERSGRFVEMLLNAKLLGGGHTAYEIQSFDGRIYVVGRHEMKVYKYSGYPMVIR